MLHRVYLARPYRIGNSRGTERTLNDIAEPASPLLQACLPQQYSGIDHFNH